MEWLFSRILKDERVAHHLMISQLFLLNLVLSKISLPIWFVWPITITGAIPWLVAGDDRKTHYRIHSYDPLIETIVWSVENMVCWQA